MDLPTLIRLLSSPDAYPHEVPEPVEVHQTHISVVFLAGRYAYKLKKPLDLGFLDFSTLERRRHFCAEEVRLNRRLAPHVYLGIVPVALQAGRVQLNGPGEVLEWAVWMRRLPEEATLLRRVERGEADAALLGRLGRRLARFHSAAEGGPSVAAYGDWPVVARNTRENLEQAAAHVGVTLSAALRERLVTLVEESLREIRPLVEQRAAQGVTRDTHGDLHLDHVYVFPGEEEPEDLVVVDCIEFNERFRYADPVADLAFLVMDLRFHGHPRLAAALADSYFEASGDQAGRSLLGFYVAYRAAVRAKVDGFAAVEGEIPAADRQRAAQRARAHWLLALRELEAPSRRPCLLMVGGLPGTGKSALARELCKCAGFELVSSDAVRKELAGLGPAESGRTGFGEGIYTPEWNLRVYRECLARAGLRIAEGGRVLVDASFREEARRAEFLGAARRWGVPALLLLRTAEPVSVFQRLRRRPAGPSDADWAVYQRAAAAWEMPAAATEALTRQVPSFPSLDGALEEALRMLGSEELL